MSLEMTPRSMQWRMEETRDWMKREIETEATRFKGFKDYEIQRIERNIAWMKNSNVTRREMVRRKIDFYKFFTEYDERRGLDFMETFPELVGFWSQCEYEANKYDNNKLV
jgi:hypothetical protein